MRRYLYSYLTLLIIFAQIAIAQDAQFTAAVSSNPVVQGEPFRLQFSVNTDASNFRPPSFEGFEVVNGPSQSNSTQIINGKYSRSLSFTYVLKAKSVGTKKIQSASIQVSGKRLRSNTIDLRVIEPSEAEKERRKQEAEQEKSMRGKAIDIIKNNLYLKTNVSKTSAFVGEQITASFKLYVNGELNLVGLEMENSPILNVPNVLFL